MANNLFQVKRTNVSGRTPNTTNPSNSQYIAAGELALNMSDGILYTSNGSAIIEVGANNTNQRITNSLTVDNNRGVYFKTINSTSSAYLIQQSDDNFVFYTTDASYNPRPVWGIYANSSTSNLQVYVPLQLNSGIVANGSIGNPGETLFSNGSAIYWGSGAGTGTVTQVNSANGIAGGPITGTGTLYVVAGNNTVFVNASGVFVNTDALPSNYDPAGAAATAYSNAIAYSGNAAQAYSNAINWSGNAALAYSNAVSTAATDASTKAATAYSNAIAYSGNAAQAYSNAISWSGNAALAYSNAVATAATDASSKAATAYSNAIAYSGNAAQAYSNAIAYSGNSALAYANAVATAATDASTKAATAYSNAIAYSGNAVQAYTNAVAYVDGKSYVNTVQLSGNLSNYALLSGATFTGNVTANNANTTYDLNVGRNMTVGGNLTVTGNVTIIGANNLSIVDNMIYLNSNSTTANPDLGFAGNYNDGVYHHAGFFRDHATGIWKVFDNYAPEPDAAVNIDQANDTFHVANFQANVIYVGNNTVYATVNTTNYTGTANNANNLGGVAAASYVNTSGSYTLSGNITLGGANIVISNTVTIYAINANGSVGTNGQFLTSNGSSIYWSSSGAGIVGTSNIRNVINTTVTTSPTNIDSISTTGISTVEYLISAKDTINSNFKSSRVVVTTDGSTAYVTEYGVVLSNNSAQVCLFDAIILTGNLILQGTGDSSSVSVSLQRITLGTSTTTGDIAASFASETASVNNALYLNGKQEINLNVNNSLTSNSTNFVGSVSAANVVSNAQLQANLANYATTGSVTANAATAYSNAMSDTLSRSGSYTGNNTFAGTNTVISSNLNVTGSFLNVASAFIANSTGAYHTGTINAASHTVGALFTANSTLVNAAAINVTGQTNTATFFATTSANVGANVQANTTTIFVGNSSVNTSITAGSVTINGIALATTTSVTANAATAYTNALSDSLSRSGSYTGNNTFAGTNTVISSNLYSSASVNIAGNLNAANIVITTNVATIGTGTYFVSNGNVGIANSTPAQKLRVEGDISDSKGDVRDIPVTTQSTTYQLAATDNGRVISTTANVTVNGAILITGEAFSIFNNSAASITITSGAGATMYLAGTATTGNRTLAQRGIATVLCVASNTFVISGGGLT